MDAELLTLAVLALLGSGAALALLYRLKRQQPTPSVADRLADALDTPAEVESLLGHELLLRRAAPSRLNCLGPKDGSVECVLTRMGKNGVSPDLVDVLLARAGEYNCQTSDGLIGALLAHGEAELARMYHRYCRQGCGYDLRELIVRHPLDGQEHMAPCPQCHRMFSWVPPKYGG